MTDPAGLALPASPTQRSGRERPLGLRFTVDLANAADPAAEWADTATAHGSRSLALATVDAATLEAAVHRVRGVLASPSPGAAAAAVNALLAAAPAATELTELDDGRWAVRPHLPAGVPAAESYLAVAAFALAEWFAERGRPAWGICAAAECELAFIDEGRRAPQRFCSTACATRTRVAAHRRAGGTGTGSGAGTVAGASA